MPRMVSNRSGETVHTTVIYGGGGSTFLLLVIAVILLIMTFSNLVYLDETSRLFLQV